MKLSQYFMPTLREAPSDADNVSATLMQRSGMIRKLAAGLYEWLPLGLRVLRKVEAIVRREMDAIGAQEVSLPVIQPKELWEETGRWKVYGKEMLRLKDRKGGEFCFAPTAEEVITDVVRREVRSWRQLPVTLYQIGLKFRDEIRPRFGVMRAREFLMKDAYSFHADDADCQKGYEKMFAAYRRIFERCGLKFKPVEAATGPIGGSYSHEFMVLAETGEETIVSCTQCSYAANIERAECGEERRSPLSPSSATTGGKGITSSPPVPAAHMAAGTGAEGTAPLPLEVVHTPGLHSVEEQAKAMKITPQIIFKTQMVMADDQPVMALVRGDHELNEAKLQRALGAGAVERMTESQYERVAGCKVGFAGPVKLPMWKTPEGKMTAVKIVADSALQGIANASSGANKTDYHWKNINIGRDFVPDFFADLRKATPQDPCPRCGEAVEFKKGIEVGHTFKLGTKYSQSLKGTYLDAQQESKPMVMGCYGIGVSRVVAAAIEQGHDASGIVWPLAIAPFAVALVPVEYDDAEVAPAAEKIYQELWSQGVEVLMDDRQERPGVRFKDMDLIGIPLRLVVSQKTLKDGQVEFKRRDNPNAERWPLAEAAARIRAFVSD